MHYKIERLPAGVEELEEVENAKCVAGCYRCLLSYYNQPDHELIDRRRDPVRSLLLRLARADMRPMSAESRLVRRRCRRHLDDGGRPLGAARS